MYQEETQDTGRCEVADESVVVSKARPEKPSNGVEEKAELTISIAFDETSTSQKLFGVAKGGSTH